MIDVNVLKGSQVRDTFGNVGRVVSVSLPWVRIGWIRANSVALHEVTYRRGDPVLWDSLEVLTIPGGWIPLGRLVGAKHRRIVPDPELKEAKTRCVKAYKKAVKRRG